MANIEKKVSDDHNQMSLTITFNKDELAEALLLMIADMMRKEDWSNENRMIQRELHTALPKLTKEVIYQMKDELADRVVKRASAELKRVALKKMLLNIDDEVSESLNNF